MAGGIENIPINELQFLVLNNLHTSFTIVLLVGIDNWCICQSERNDQNSWHSSNSYLQRSEDVFITLFIYITMLCGADNISRNIHMYLIRIQADLLHVTHVDTYVINQNSYVKSNVTFGLGDNSRKVRI